MTRGALGWWLLAWLVPSAWSMPEPRPNHPETALIPPPTHVVWDEYPVGGYQLTNWAMTDSLGRHPALILPKGSLLVVPRTVQGEDPAARADAATHRGQTMKNPRKTGVRHSSQA